MPESRLTLKDVAASAGVSPATASLVLRDAPSPFISDKTRRRVREAAKKLNYRKNQLAAGLRRGKTDIVALVVYGLSSPALAATLISAQETLQQNGMRAFVWQTAFRPEMEERAFGDISSLMVSGVLVGCELHASGGGFLRELCEGGMPVVLLQPVEDVAAHLVAVDRESVTYLGVRHLLSLGRRRIGITGSKPFLDSVHGWGRGYRRALEEFDLSLDDAPTFPLPRTGLYQAGLEIGRRVLASDPRPDGLFATDDEVAIGVMKACREAGVRVPEDLALVGHDDLPVAAFAEVPLTTIRNPTQKTGELAAELLLKDIRETRSGPPETIRLEPELIVRESCGAGNRGSR